MHTAVITAAMLASFYTTPNGTVIDWYGHIVTPAPIVQTIVVPKPIKTAVPASLPIIKPAQIFKPFNDLCWYNDPTASKELIQFSMACGG